MNDNTNNDRLLREMHDAIVGTVDKPGIARRIEAIEDRCGERGIALSGICKAVYGNGTEGIADRVRAQERRWGVLSKVVWALFGGVISIGFYLIRVAIT